MTTVRRKHCFGQTTTADLTEGQHLKVCSNTPLYPHLDREYNPSLQNKRCTVT